jgi:hypothetical protein
VTARSLLIAGAFIQGIFVFTLLVLVFVNRWYRRRRRAKVDPQRAVVDALFRRWAAGDAPIDALAQAIVTVPARNAIELLSAWSGRLPAETWRKLATALHGGPWARRVRAAAKSRRWWKRLEAARFLAAAGVPEDTPTLVLLIKDAHAAVHLAAVSALNHVNSPELAAAAIDRLSSLPLHVGSFYASTLRRARAVAVPLLDARLGNFEDPALARIAEYAARLQEPSLRARFTALASHPDREVRAQAARALASQPHPDSEAALLTLLTDSAWVVRAQAARGLGMLGGPAAVPLLRKALRDPEWWVRLRAALALTRFGGPGRDALLQEERGADAGARSVTELVLGLSPQALAEYAT